MPDRDPGPLQHLISELQRYSTPTLAYDLLGIRRDLELLQSHLRKAVGSRLAFSILFSVKANANPDLLRWLRCQGVGAETSSMSEFRAAREAGFPCVSATSPGLSIRQVRHLLASGVEVNIDNLAQLKGVRRGSQIGLRLRMPLDPDSDLRDGPQSRFGVSLENSEVLEAVRSRGCHIVRLHGHLRDIGSAGQLLYLTRRLVAAKKLLPSACALNFGGGMTRLYRNPLQAEDAWMQCSGALQELPAGTRILVEPGAQLTTNHGYLATRVLSVTNPSAGQQVAVVDSSKWNLVAWSQYRLIYPESDDTGLVTQIAGPTCYENDIWATGLRLPALKPGRQLIFGGLGAYVASMAKRMHGMRIPREVLV